MVYEDKIIYEHIKFPKTVKPVLLKQENKIIGKYSGKSYTNYVFPVFTRKHTTTTKKTTRVYDISRNVSQALVKMCKMLLIREHITRYSAYESFILNIGKYG